MPLNCLFLFFIHLRLVLLTQIPALNDKNSSMMKNLKLIKHLHKLFDDNSSLTKLNNYWILINIQLL